MTGTNTTVMPGLMVATQMTGLSATTPIIASTFAAPSYSLETSNSSARYVLASSLAPLALGVVLAGCRNDPAPAAIPHESALPPNQGNCPPNSRDPFCQGYKASVQEMRHEREEGHHSDQALFGLLGAGLGVPLLIALVVSIRRGRKIKRLEAELKANRPPDSGDAPRQSGWFSRWFRRDKTPAAKIELSPDQAAATSTNEPVTAEAARRGND